MTFLIGQRVQKRLHMPLGFSVSPSSGERVFLAELPAATAAKKPKRTYNRYDDGTTVTKKKTCTKYYEAKLENIVAQHMMYKMGDTNKV